MKKPKPKEKFIHVRISEDLYKNLKKRNIFISEVVRQALEKSLK